MKHNFGHGSDGLANLLVVLNLLAFAFHSVLDCLRGLWHQARALLVTRRDFFRDVQTLTKYVYFPHWTALLETLLEERPLAQSRGPTPARPPTSPAAPAPAGRSAALRHQLRGLPAKALPHPHSAGLARPATLRLALRKPVPKPIPPTSSATLRIAAGWTRTLPPLMSKW